ncbi:MAG TPA: META domain-containing protein [Agromyces mariniharenae]|nr:META domain-containing protein [Agromyces mariniharenae]
MARMRNVIIGGGAVIALLMLTGCLGVQGSAKGGDIDPVGTWGDPSKPSEPYLSLADDGSLSGSDGCNTLSGSWSVDEGEQVLFEDVAMTRMFCEGVDDWLSGLTAATIADTTMTVLGQDGSEIGQLERTSETPATN